MINLSAPFIKRPIMTTLVMIALILAGVAAFLKLPVSDLPAIDEQTVEIMTGYTGASPEKVLNLVTIPLEKELTHIRGLQEITSKSSPGHSSITLTFSLSKDMNVAIRDIQSALNAAEGDLPSEINSRPTYHIREKHAEPISYILLTSEHSNVRELRNYADTYIISRLSRIEGVAQVVTYGAEKSIWLKLNPEVMAARHISFDQVIDAVQQHTEQIPLGSIQTGTKRLSLELTQKASGIKDLENISIGATGVSIKDIGEVTDESGQERSSYFVTRQGRSNVLVLAVQKVSEGNTVAISDAVRSALSVIQKELPPSIHANLWFDKAVWIKESLLDVQWTLIIAFFLVVAVIYCSLGRFVESMITSAALPLSIIGTFAIMYLADFSLNLLSLLALTLSVGFVVDDAIVVLENIVRWHEKGISSREASLAGSKQISFTILSMTLSLIAVFIPLLFMEGMNGRLFREFSITLATAILVSGCISLTLTPMLCSRFLSEHNGDSRMQKTITAAYTWMIELYERTLRRCLHFPKTIVVLSLLSIAASYFLFSQLSVNLIPPEDRGFFFAFVKLPKGIPPAQVKEEQKKLEQLVQANPHVETFLDLNFHNTIFFVIRLPSSAERPPIGQVMNEIQQAIDTVPGTQTFVRPYQMINLDFDFGNAGQYQLLVRGLDLEEVEKGTDLLKTTMATHPEFLFVDSTLNNDTPVLALEIDEDRVQQLGLERKKIQSVLQQAYGQPYVGALQNGPLKEEIYLDLLPQYQNNVNALSYLYFPSPDGEFLPLRAFVQWKETLGPSDLTHHDQLPSHTIHFSLVSGVHPNVGIQLAQDIASDVLPESVSIMLSGAARAISSTISHTLLLLLAAAIVMYLVLGILYESFIHPLTILSSLPLAALGGILTLFLFNEPVSIFSAVGFLLLIGIVKKNGIMMVDYAIEAQNQGADQQRAILDACIIRFRPIMMTTVAAIMGALPIALGIGESGAMRRGLGLVIVGGLLFSQVLTLYVTPVLYLVFDRLRK